MELRFAHWLPFFTRKQENRMKSTLISEHGRGLRQSLILNEIRPRHQCLAAKTFCHPVFSADSQSAILAVMNELSRIPRSPLLMKPQESGLLVVDVQEKLIAAIQDHARIVWNIRRLLEAASIMSIKTSGTEQYPDGLGPTVEPLRAYLDSAPSKLTFSCGGCPEIFSGWQQEGIHRVLVVGIEAHVCVMQTVLDLLADGFEVYVAVDAVGSRHAPDRTTALQRMESAGATMTTTEMCLFEWCDAAGTPCFKQISRLVRETPPE